MHDSNNLIDVMIFKFRLQMKNAKFLGLPWSRTKGWNTFLFQCVAYIQNRGNTYRGPSRMLVSTSTKKLRFHICITYFFYEYTQRRYTPLKRIENMPAPLPYDPIKCNGCSAVLNPYV